MGCIPSKKNVESEPPMRSIKNKISGPIAVYKPGQSSTDYLFMPSTPVLPTPQSEDPRHYSHSHPRRREDDHDHHGHHVAEVAAVGIAATAGFGVAAYAFDASTGAGGADSGADGGDAGGAGGDGGGGE